MVRLPLADVPILRGSGITVHIRFSGGATKTLELPKPLTAWELRTTPGAIVSEIDRLTDQYTDKQIVQILNERGALSGCGQRFHNRIIARVRREYNLKPRYDRLGEGLADTRGNVGATGNQSPLCGRLAEPGSASRVSGERQRRLAVRGPRTESTPKGTGHQTRKTASLDGEHRCGSQEVQYEA